MIEIKTQEQFDDLATTIQNTPSTGELIRIYSLADDVPYELTTALDIRRSNVIIEGVGKPKIKLNTTETTSPAGNIINIMGWGGTAQGGAAGYITLSSSETGLDDFCNGFEVAIISGTGKGQVRLISDYTASDKHAVPSVNWTTNPDSTSVYRIFLTNVSIKNLQLTGDRYHTGGAKGYRGIYIENCGYAQTAGLTSGTYSRYDSSTNGNAFLNRSGVKIENCVIEQISQQTLFITKSSLINVKDNIVRDGVNHGIQCATPCSSIHISRNKVITSGIGIYIDGMCISSTITKNLVYQCSQQGIYLYSLINSIVSGNIVQNNNSYGIYLSSANNNTISGNTTQNNNNHGIEVLTSSNNAVTNNIILNNLGSGIRINTSSLNNTVSGNIINSHYDCGILLYNASNYNTVSGNTLQYNTNDGITLLLNSDKNCVCGNQCISNGRDGIYLIGADNDYNNIYGNVALSNTINQYVSGGGTGNIATSAVNSW